VFRYLPANPIGPRWTKSRCGRMAQNLCHTYCPIESAAPSVPAGQISRNSALTPADERDAKRGVVGEAGGAVRTRIVYGAVKNVASGPPSLWHTIRVASAQSLIVDNPGTERPGQEHRQPLAAVQSITRPLVQAIDCATRVPREPLCDAHRAAQILRNSPTVIITIASEFLEDGRMEKKQVEYPCPLARGERILVAVDGSAHSDAAVDLAINMAKVCHSELFFVTVIALYPEMMKLAEAIEESPAKETRRILEKAHEKARQGNVSCETIVHIGPEPHKFIVQEATDRGVGLIVMGTHGRTGLKRLLMGSVAERVLGHAPCAVLVTPA
jgi:nucleotide-binding universal stress UspA family protein